MDQAPAQTPPLRTMPIRRWRLWILLAAVLAAFVVGGFVANWWIFNRGVSLSDRPPYLVFSALVDSLADSYCGLRKGEMVNDYCTYSDGWWCRWRCESKAKDAGRPCSLDAECEKGCLVSLIQTDGENPEGCQYLGHKMPGTSQEEGFGASLDIALGPIYSYYQCSTSLQGSCAAVHLKPSCRMFYELIEDGLVRGIYECAIGL